uniref:Uncharacterized protein n=1 Tax=Hyaloperonospora arabidopsidis (strain Emoy2) TaxID=559515 RepID=M4BD78_HYAAE
MSGSRAGKLRKRFLRSRKESNDRWKELSGCTDSTPASDTGLVDQKEPVTHVETPLTEASNVFCRSFTSF